MRRFSFVSFVLALFVAGVFPQEGPSPDDLVREAKKVLRDIRATDEERETARYQMLEAGLPGAKDLLAIEAARAAKVAKDRKKAEAKFAKQFDKAAAKLQKKRLTKSVKAEVEANRKVIAKHARDQSLTKGTIQSVCDPARDSLLEAWFVPVAEVLESGKDLGESSAAIGELRAAYSSALGWVDRILVEHEGKLESPKKLPPALASSWEDELEFLVLVSATESKRDRETLLANREKEPEILAEEANGILFLNRWRVAFGQGVYAIDTRLCEACRDHSKDMKELDFFSHTSPVAGKETFGQRAANFKTSASSENIAMGAQTGPDSIVQWWYSPGHHRNMLGGAARVGLGQHERHWTQLFGR